MTDILTLAERMAIAKAQIRNTLEEFKEETGFTITDIEIVLIDASSNCGKNYLITDPNLKITK